MKVPALVATPPGVVTLMGPVVAPGGTVAVIWIAVLTVKLAFRPLNRTAVVPEKFVPLITTFAPAGPLPGAKPEMDGAKGIKAQFSTTSPEAPPYPSTA